MFTNKIPQVLIVDDSAVNVMILERILVADYHIFTANNGADALTIAAENELDLILLDVMMPDMNGFETCRKLKADEQLKDIPVIFITALDDMKDEMEGLRLGAIDYIIKPVKPGIVHVRVKNHIELKRGRDILARLSLVDGLTGIPNRRAFDESFDTEWRRTKRAKDPLSLIIIDIDQFKDYNDTYGHVAGDACLRRVAEVLAESLVRAGDFVARFGGEEFVCLLPSLDQESALVVAEKLRKAVVDAALVHENSATAPHVTISVGLTTTTAEDEETTETLLKLADDNLYKAKENGRNQVIAH